MLLELCAPYVKNNGVFLACKGSSAEEEVREAETAAKKLGMELVEVAAAGPQDTNHVVVIYRRVADTLSLIHI